MNPEQLNELRLFYLASGAILPLIEEAHDEAYLKLLAKFREGETNLLPLVASCNAQQSLIEDIKTKLELYETINNKEQS